MNEDELKHWGILNMKWGIRRYQNPDGSLTEEGREHYNVGPPRDKGKELINEASQKKKNDNSPHDKGKESQNKAGYKKKNNNPSRKKTSKVDRLLDKLKPKKKTESGLVRRRPEEMSNDELYDRVKRNKALTNYYNAQNDYLKAQAYNKELLTPKKKTNQFLHNIFVRPLETVLAKSVEFGLYSAADSFLSVYDSKAADRYMEFVLKSGNKDKDKDKDKQQDNHKKRN